MLVGIPVLLSREYRRQRILSWFGIGDNTEIGYQASQSLISLGNGGIFGVGLGNSIEKNRNMFNAFNVAAEFGSPNGRIFTNY